MTATLTDQQRAALETRDVSVGLSAGAGCGKTFVLTRRFLAHLELTRDPEVLSRMVAITFTDRAAREMRDRIRTACRERSRELIEPDHAIDADGDAPPSGYWRRILDGLDEARISTIHSFCSSLLRGYAVEAELDPAFEVAQGPKIESLRLRIVTRTLNRLLRTEDPSAIHLVRHYELERTRDHLGVLLLAATDFPFDRWADRSVDDLLEIWKTVWQSRVVPAAVGGFLTEPKVVESLTKLRELDLPTGLFHDRRARVFDAVERLAEDCSRVEELDLIVENAGVARAGKAKTELIAHAGAESYDTLRDEFKTVREQTKKLVLNPDFTNAETSWAAETMLAWLTVTREVTDAYRTEKQRQAVVDFDDLLVRTRDLLRNPSVRERVSASIDFLMVDEFQDTDPVQAEIVSLLLGEQIVGGRLFFVGDSKQSIYRFRGADPGVFGRLREELPPAGRLPLTTNFRSQPAILGFVNHLFSQPFGDGYEPLVPFYPQMTPNPSVELILSEPFDRESSDSKPSAEECREAEAEAIAGRLAEMIADGVPRIPIGPGEESENGVLRPVRAGDIAILFRALSDVSIYEEALRRAGLNYYLIGSKAFYAQQEVHDLANFCQCIDDPEDEVSLLGVLRSPFFGLPDEALFEAVTASESLMRFVWGPDELPEDLIYRERLDSARTVLRELRSVKDRLVLSDWLALAMDRTGYDAALVAEFLGERKLANLRKLFDQAREFDRAGLFTLREFVDRLRGSVLAGTDEELAATQAETGDVIRLLTIHKSKGLEFPVVVVPDLMRERRGSDFQTLDPTLGALVALPADGPDSKKHLGREAYRILEGIAETEESLRVFYVAATRAANHLILSTGEHVAGTPPKSWLRLLSERFDLNDGTPIGSDPDADPPTPQLSIHRGVDLFPISDPVRQTGGRDFSDLWDRLAETEPEPPPGYCDLPPVAVTTRVLDLRAIRYGEQAEFLTAVRERLQPCLGGGQTDRSLIVRLCEDLPRSQRGRVARSLSELSQGEFGRRLRDGGVRRWDVVVSRTRPASDHHPRGIVHETGIDLLRITESLAEAWLLAPAADSTNEEDGPAFARLETDLIRSAFADRIGERDLSIRVLRVEAD